MIGVIADDLTGAAELGAVGLRHGLRAEVLCSGEPSGKAQLVCISTESRSLPPRKAATQAGAAARLLRDAGAEWIFKKTDSVLRGQVTAELEAIMAKLNCPRTLLLPANPSLGRTIRDGRYFIHGQPINRTDFARDPEFPRRSAKVLRLLLPPKTLPLAVLPRGAAFAPAGILVGEVSSAEHLEEWIARCEADMLLAGGAEAFGAALRERKHRSEAPGKSRHLAREIHVPVVGGSKGPGRELFVCGSASAACREFVDRSRQQGVPVIGLPEELTRGCELSRCAKRAVAGRVHAALRTNPRVILDVGLPPIHERTLARRLAAHLAALAAGVLKHGQVSQVFAEGGETAAAVLRAMGWMRLKVVRELAPGVATLEPDGGEGVWLTIKPGSYRWPAEVLRCTRSGPHTQWG